MIRTDFTQALSDIRALMPECRGITAEYPYHDYDFVALRTKIWSERYQEHLYIEYFASVKLMQEPSALVMILRHEISAMEDERAQAEHEMTSP